MSALPPTDKAATRLHVTLTALESARTGLTPLQHQALEFDRRAATRIERARLALAKAKGILEAHTILMEKRRG